MLFIVVATMVWCSGQATATGQPSAIQAAGATALLIPQWNQLATSNTGPGPRFDFGLQYSPASDRLFLFGGRDGNDQAYNDVWVLTLGDLTNLAWQPIAVDAPTKPGARHSVAMMVDTQEQYLYVAAGQLQNDATLADIWRLDLVGETWEDLSVSAGEPPVHRYALAAGALRDDLILSHGFGSGVGRHNDTWRFDTATNQWQVVVATADSNPVGRCLLDGVVAGEQLVMHGGCSNADCTLDDTWLLEIGAAAWTEVTSLPKPAGRRHQSVAYFADLDQVMLFGGIGDNGAARNDLWSLDMAGKRWQQLAPVDAPNAPPARHSHKAVWIPATAQRSAGMLVYGGAQGAGALDDLWLLTLAPDHPLYLPLITTN
jgi:hypothetical protein